MNERSQRNYEDNYLKRGLTIALLILLVAVYGFGVTERTKEQVSHITDISETDDTANQGDAPIGSHVSLARQSCLIQFVEEASGLLSRRSRESVRRFASSAKDVQARLQYLFHVLLLAIILLAITLSLILLYGDHISPSSIRIVTYLHDQDGLK